MTNFLASSFGKVADDLADYIQSGWSLLSPESAFAKYVCHSKLNLPVFSETLAVNNEIKHRINEAPVLAAIGYQIATTESLRLNSDLLSLWAEGFERLSARNPFPADRASFFYRPVELLGICVGALNNASLPDSKLQWLISVIKEGETKLADSESWNFIFYKYAEFLLAPDSFRLAAQGFNVASIPEKALLRWLITINAKFAELSHLKSSENELNAALLEFFSSTSKVSLNAALAALYLFSLMTAVSQSLHSEIDAVWQLNKQKKDALHLLSVICQRFHRYAKEFGQRYSKRGKFEINDEYDVQDLLRAVLRMHFDDVRPEEWTPSYAGNSSRIDFLLKPEQIIIEVKMTRKGLDQKELTNQLIIDKERYRAHSDCRTLVCLVYDPKGICTNPTALETDLLTNDDNLQTIVIVVPN